VARWKITNPRTFVVAYFLVFTGTVFLMKLLMTDESIASNLVTSVILGVVVVTLLWWLPKRSHH
jgi:hypothetical protein